MKKHLLLIATNNRGKIKEIRNILKDIPVKIVTIRDIKQIPNNFEIDETGKTFSQNAKLKAATLGKISKLLTLADDSGLVVDALDGRPGVYSHRYGKTTAERNKKLLKEIKDVPASKRTARFIAAVAIYDPEENKSAIFEDVSEGKITHRSLGTRGFGYDPIFFSNELSKTFAQATLKEKNEVSHRARALRKAKPFLLKLLKDSK